MKPPTLPAVAVLAALVLPAQAALARTPQLEIISSQINAETQQLTVTLINQSAKKITAYTIAVRQFDGTGKELQEAPLVVGRDNIMMLMLSAGDEEGWSPLLGPGASASAFFGLLPNAVRVIASVVAVVYLDRTAEGDSLQIAHFFDARQRFAEQARAVTAELMGGYPAVSEITSKLANIASIHVRTEAVGELLRAGASATKDQWNAALAQQKTLVEFLALQSKEVK